MAKEKQDLEIEDIYEFEKSAKKVAVSAIPIVVRGGEKRLYVGIREKYKDGEIWKPSEKGVTFEAKYIPTLISAINYALPIEAYPELDEISIIPKNSSNEIHLSLKKYMNSEYLDIRSFYKKDGVASPSKSGITIPPDCLEDLLKGLNMFNEKYPE